MSQWWKNISILFLRFKVSGDFSHRNNQYPNWENEKILISPSCIFYLSCVEQNRTEPNTCNKTETHSSEEETQSVEILDIRFMSTLF